MTLQDAPSGDKSAPPTGAGTAPAPAASGDWQQLWVIGPPRAQPAPAPVGTARPSADGGNDKYNPITLDGQIQQSLFGTPPPWKDPMATPAAREVERAVMGVVPGETASWHSPIPRHPYGQRRARSRWTCWRLKAEATEALRALRRASSARACRPEPWWMPTGILLCRVLEKVARWCIESPAKAS